MMTANGKRICDAMPGRPTVVVVQSDDLAAWQRRVHALPASSA
jgi:hypothetical protein